MSQVQELYEALVKLHLRVCSDICSGDRHCQECSEAQEVIANYCPHSVVKDGECRDCGRRIQYRDIEEHVRWV